MSSSEKPSTKIVVGVVSGLTLAGLLYVFSNWVPPFFKWVGTMLHSGWVWIASTHSVPGWLLAPLVIAGIWCALWIIAAMWKSSPPPGPPEPNWRDFTEFEFEGVLWRWHYDRQGGLYNLVSFCPQSGCDMQTYARMGNYFGAGRETTRYTCDRCHHAPEINGSSEQIENRVSREIQRLLRGDGWKNHVRVTA
ncbi:MAG: hypothetical protein QOE70_6378 [Chthoniobacter sp.]|jgi:hypothetical protein|nr:hypothetical protein [Chthoniobacter sp.]